MVSTNGLHCRAHWFLYILMYGRGEWILIYISSQHKRRKWSVRPVFPIFLFAVTMQKTAILLERDSNTGVFL